MNLNNILLLVLTCFGAELLTGKHGIKMFLSPVLCSIRPLFCLPEATTEQQFPAHDLI